MPTAIWNGMFDDHGVSPVIFDVILGYSIVEKKDETRECFLSFCGSLLVFIFLNQRRFFPPKTHLSFSFPQNNAWTHLSPLTPPNPLPFVTYRYSIVRIQGGKVSPCVPHMLTYLNNISFLVCVQLVWEISCRTKASDASMCALGFPQGETNEH